MSRASVLSWPVTARPYVYPLIALVRREIRKRYAASMLGVAWTILQPLTLIGVYAFVFGMVFRTERPAGTTTEFIIGLLAGMLPYLAISDGLQRSMYALREDRTLLEREAFPAIVVPASRVVSASIGEVVGIAVVVLVGVVTGVSATIWLVLLPALMLLRLVVTLALSWLLSVLAVFISDLIEVLSLFLTVWLFLTPIFYAPSLVPGPLRWTLWLNPLHLIVSSYRAVLVEGRAPGLEGLLLVAWAAGLIGLSTWFFRKAIDRAKDLL